MMYGFPVNLDPRVFVGHRLESVLFAEQVIVLHFSGDIKIQIEGTVRVKVSLAETAVEEHPVKGPEMKESCLVGAVGRIVEYGDLADPNELCLRFSGDYSLLFPDDSPHYEVCLITIGDREIIV